MRTSSKYCSEYLKKTDQVREPDTYLKIKICDVRLGGRALWNGFKLLRVVSYGGM